MKDTAALRAKFDTFDADGNGLVNQQEFTSLVRKLGLHLTDAKASKAFHSLDENQDGQVDFDQLSAWWFKYDRP